MSKRKIGLVALSLCLVAILAVGGTLAYLTSTDSKTNTFTVGNVKIELVEVFDTNNANLMPGSKTSNNINKDVWVKNTGANSAWVRVKVYVPFNLDKITKYPEDFNTAAIANILHWNTVNNEIWNVQQASWDAKLVTLDDGKQYNEYIFYYNDILGAGETTQQLLDQVYLDSKIDCDVDKDGNATYYIMKDGNKVEVDLSNLNIIVKAEAIQADGFNTYAEAFAAFDAQNK